MRERWVGESSAAGEWCPRDSDELSVGALETRGTVLEAASEVGLALSSAASVWSSVGAAREHRIFFAVRVEFVAGARETRRKPAQPADCTTEVADVRPRSQSLGDATRTSPRTS